MRFPRSHELAALGLCWALTSRVLADDAAQGSPVVPPGASPDGFRSSGFLQVDGVLAHQASQDELDPGGTGPLNQNRVLIRRARVRLDGRYGFVRGTVQLDGNTVQGPQLRLLAAELSVQYPRDAELPLVSVGAGLFLLPFGFETSELAQERMFLETATWVGALFPGRRDLGARMHGGYRFLRYAVAVTNGQPTGAAQVPLRDPNRQKDLIGRLGAEGAFSHEVVGTLGVSLLWGTGFHPGVLPTKDVVSVRDANQDGLVQTSEIELIPGSSGQRSANFRRYALGADVGVSYTLPLLGKGRVYAEGVIARDLDRALYVADPEALARTLRELGLMAGVRQAITRHVEIGVRYDRYEPDRDAFARRGRLLLTEDAHFSAWSVAIAWCTLPHLRVTLEYDHVENPYGQARSGARTTLPSDSLTLRAQVVL